jgi:hypothetical protein
MSTTAPTLLRADRGPGVAAAASNSCSGVTADDERVVAHRADLRPALGDQVGAQGVECPSTVPGEVGDGCTT